MKPLAHQYSALGEAKLIKGSILIESRPVNF
jgi:hypothetical protein